MCQPTARTLAKRKSLVARIESSVTSVSWIPSDAMQGIRGLITDLGVARWDLPPPDQLENLDELIAADTIRFANELRAWIEVEGGQITRYGHFGKGRMSQSLLRAGSRQIAFAAVALPDLRPDPKVDLTSVRFVQTTGGRTGMPLPRRVRRSPFVQLTPPTAWTTLALTIHADGSSHHEVVGASPFPRHWIYDHAGTLVAKTGLIDFTRWLREAFGRHTPWGDEDSTALVTAVESALERRLSRLVLDARLPFRGLAPGATLVEQGAAGREIYVIFDGLLAVELDGQVVSEIGPGAFVGELAALEHDVMVVSVVPARVRDRPRVQATLATILGVNPMRMAAKFEQWRFDPAVAVIVAEIPAKRFRKVERQLRAVEGLVFTRRPGQDAPPGRRTATLRAVTPCRVAVVPEALLDRDVLAELAKGRRGADLDSATNPSSE
jgi:CRP-like cAMP-binding protein